MATIMPYPAAQRTGSILAVLRRAAAAALAVVFEALLELN